MVASKHIGPFLAFDRAWFARHQRALLWLLRFRLFRWCLRIETDQRIVRILPHSYTVWLGGDRFCADFRTHWKYSKRIYYAFRPLWLVLHFWDWLLADRFAPRLSFGFASLTTWPEPGNGTTTCDASVQRSGSSGTWAALRDGAGTAAWSNNSSGGVYFLASSSSNQWASLYREIQSYDCSSLAGAMITGATLSLYGESKDDGQGWLPTLQIYGATPAAKNTATASDFSQIDTTARCDIAITFAAWSTSAYNSFALNSSGLALVAPAVISIGLREAKYDAANSPPTWANLGSVSFYWKAADVAGTSSDPKLVVYATGNLWPEYSHLTVGAGMSRVDYAT